METTCNRCKHYAELEMVDEHSCTLITLGYCKAIASKPYRTPDYPACKRFAANPDEL